MFDCIVPLLSLVNNQGSPIPDLIEKHLLRLKSHQMTGVLVMGTTGEFPHFSVAQRKAYLEAIVSANPGLPIMAHIGASNLADTFELQTHALSQRGITSLLWMPPFYFRSTELNGLENMLDALLERHNPNIPFYLYHNPKLSQVDISSQMLEKADGIKDTSGDFTRIEMLRRRYPNKIIHVGTDTQISKSFTLETNGVIPAMANVFPEIYEAVLFNQQWEHEEKLKMLRDLLDHFHKIPALKAYLNHLQLSTQKTDSVLPYKSLSNDESATLIKAIQGILSGEISYAG